MTETVRDEFVRDMLDAVDLSEMHDVLAKKLALLRERPDLMWLENDTEEEQARKQAEFDALMLSRETKQ